MSSQSFQPNANPPPSPLPLGSASNLAKLLPTGTVLVFETLISTFSNDGTCLVANKVLTYILLASCTISCLVLSLTDSFIVTTENGEKIYHGIATLSGFYIFNRDDKVPLKTEDERLKKYKITKRDYLHMLLQVVVFWAVALSSRDVQECIISSSPSDNWKEVTKNLPIGVGVVCSIFFAVIPTRRRGIGYTDLKPSVVDLLPPKQEEKKNVPPLEVRIDGN